MELKNYPLILQQTYDEALEKNSNIAKHWEKIKEEYTTLESHLAELPKSLTRDVMVPIGSHAFMRGKIVHTNEILVCLGQGYFVKRSVPQSLEICKKRTKICSDMLIALEKERALLSNSRELPLQEEAFTGAREIVEHYDEEKLKHWREEHKRKEKEYRQKLAELRNNKTDINDEESLWKRLDDLELLEELEEELDRLHANKTDYDEEEEEDDDDVDDDDDYDDINDNENSDGNDDNHLESTALPNKHTVSSENIESPVSDIPCNPPSRRVSFADYKESSSDSDFGDEVLRIEFKHSNYNIRNNCKNDRGTELNCVIQSPGDLYTHFKEQFLSKPKSILKNASNVVMDNTSLLQEEDINEHAATADSEEDLESKNHILCPISDEVVERDVTSIVPAAPAPSQRPVSRFKASRMQKKR